MSIHKNSKVGFIHIPKNGGTSICDSFGFTKTHENIVQSKRKYGNIKYFTTCRNPYDRFVSSYEYVRMKKSYWHNYTNNTKHPLYDKLSKISFDECCEILKNNPNILTKYLQFKTQTEFITNQNGKVDTNIEIFKLEDMNNGSLESFLKELEIEGSLKKTNTSKRKDDYNLYYNDETKKIVYDFYRKDFEAFRYEK